MKEFDRAYIEAELRRLGDTLARPARLHVIGGAAMAFRGQKASTKDIDIVVDSETESDALVNGLLGIGYADPSDLPEPYRRMGARRVLENADGFAWDVFVREVVGFEFSDRMRTRVEAWMASGQLTVFAAAPEDIFAFKALTDRERDRDDMNSLFTNGLDQSIIREEVLVQAERRTGKRFAAFFYRGLEEFVDKHGVLYPGLDEFEALYLRDQVAEILATLLTEGSVDLARAAEELGAERGVVEAAAQRLVRQGLARVEAGELRQA